jgi:hypothetical protein
MKLEAKAAPTGESVQFQIASSRRFTLISQ